MASSGSNEESDRFNPGRTGKKRSKESGPPAPPPKIKKRPQRGMGVAELERLRMQECNQQALSEMGSYVRTPFISDPVPIGLPTKFPPGFGPVGYNPSTYVVTSSGTVMIPGQYQVSNPYGSDCMISKELPSIPSTDCKKKHSEADQLKELVGLYLSEENNNKEMVVEHKFFPAEVGVDLEMNLGSSSVGIQSVSAENDDDDDVIFLGSRNPNVIDLSLKL